MPENPSRDAARQTLSHSRLNCTLMRMREVCAVTGLSRSGIYRLLRDGCFPKPVPLTRHVSAFTSTEIQQWINARIAERDGMPPAGGAP